MTAKRCMGLCSGCMCRVTGKPSRGAGRARGQAPQAVRRGRHEWRFVSTVRRAHPHSPGRPPVLPLSQLRSAFTPDAPPAHTLLPPTRRCRHRPPPCRPPPLPQALGVDTLGARRRISEAARQYAARVKSTAKMMVMYRDAQVCVRREEGRGAQVCVRRNLFSLGRGRGRGGRGSGQNSGVGSQSRRGHIR